MHVSLVSGSFYVYLNIVEVHAADEDKYNQLVRKITAGTRAYHCIRKLVVGKKCSSDACGCHREHLSCTNYYNCCGEYGCCNPPSRLGVTQSSDDDNAEIGDAGEET